jgi:hypothetical protein
MALVIKISNNIQYYYFIKFRKSKKLTKDEFIKSYSKTNCKLLNNFFKSFTAVDSVIYF